MVTDAEASTSGGGSAPAHANGAKKANGVLVNGSAVVVNGVNGAASAAPSGGAVVSTVVANGATVNLGEVDAVEVLAIEDGIDACAAGQLEACASDR